MKSYTPYYNLFCDLTERGLDAGGLCWEISWEIGQKEESLFIELFGPTGDAETDSESWWGGERGEFTPLRQNMLLFLACMNGEL